MEELRGDVDKCGRKGVGEHLCPAPMPAISCRRRRYLCRQPASPGDLPWRGASGNNEPGHGDSTVRRQEVWL